MVAVYVTVFLYGLDTTIAADVQLAIVESLGGIKKLTRIGVGFPLELVATILPIGSRTGFSRSNRSISFQSSCLRLAALYVGALQLWIH